MTHDPYRHELAHVDDAVDDEAGSPLSGAHLLSGAPVSDAMEINIRLRTRDYRELQRRGRQAGLRPRDLVETWLEEELWGSRRPVDVKRDLEALVSLLRDERQGVDRAVDRIARLESVASDERQGVDRAVDRIARLESVDTHLIARLNDVEKAVASPRWRVPQEAGARSPRQSIKLHEEISDVLREQGPMRVVDIARIIESRHNYKPRTASAITASAISARISHPRYRSLFVRQGDKISVTGGST